MTIHEALTIIRDKLNQSFSQTGADRAALIVDCYRLAGEIDAALKAQPAPDTMQAQPAPDTTKGE